MEGQLYGPIPVTQNQTRLLRLHQASEESPLSGDLVVADVKADGLVLTAEQRPVEYIALSYIWGTAPFSHEITLNSVPWKIKENLSNFLRQCRSQQQEGETYLWIDALVINQFDPDEKSHQVGRMLNFYQSAHLVYVWLGPATAFTEQAILFLQELLKDVERENEEICDEALRGLRDLYSRSYPRRMWIRQEVWGAKNIIVRCGRYAMPLEVFKAGVTFSEEAGDGLDDEGSEVSDLDIYSSPTSLAWLHEKLELDEQQLAAINFLNQRDVPDKRSTLTENNGRKDILTLLYESTNYESTDIRDRIFALIGMCDDPTIPIDYRHTPSEVFTSFAQHQILHTNSLDSVLDQTAKFGAKQSDLDLPSWVPDWRTIEVVWYTYNDVTSFDLDGSFDAAHPRVLSLQGFVLGRLDVDEASFQEDVPVVIGWSNINPGIGSWAREVDGLYVNDSGESTIYIVPSGSESLDNAGKARDLLVACCGARNPILLRPSQGSERDVYEFVRTAFCMPPDGQSYDDSGEEPRFRKFQGGVMELLSRGKAQGVLETFRLV